jgi:hypothetical protein
MSIYEEIKRIKILITKLLDLISNEIESIESDNLNIQHHKNITSMLEKLVKLLKHIQDSGFSESDTEIISEKDKKIIEQFFSKYNPDEKTKK